MSRRNPFSPSFTSGSLDDLIIKNRCEHETHGSIFVEGSDWQQCSLCGEMYCLDDITEVFNLDYAG